MKYLNDREKKFTEILSDVSFDVDTNELWEALEDRMPSERKKRRFPFWLFGGLAGIVIVGVSLWMMDAYSNSAANSGMISEVDSNREPSVFDRSAALEETIEQVAEQRNNSDLEVDFEDLVDRESSVTTTRPTSVSGGIEGRNEDVQSIESGQRLFSESLFYSATNGTTALGRPNPIDKSLNSASQLWTKKTVIETDQDQDALFQSLALLPSSECSQLDNNRKIKSPLQDFYAAPIEVLKSSTKWNPYYKFSLGSNINLLSYDPSNIDSNVLSSFTSKERSLPGITSGIELGFQNERGWKLFGGLSHMQLVNQYRNYDPEIRAQDIQGTKIVEVNAQGETNPISGTVQEITTSSYAQSIFRIQNVLDGYIGIGKVYNLNKGWSIGASARANYNFFSAAKGYYFTQEKSVTAQLRDDSESNYKKHMGLGGRLELNLEKSLSNTIALSVNPSVSSYLNPIKVGTNYTIKNSQFGLSVGITYRPCREQN